jgi:hypothetical protein
VHREANMSSSPLTEYTFSCAINSGTKHLQISLSVPITQSTEDAPLSKNRPVQSSRIHSQYPIPTHKAASTLLQPTSTLPATHPNLLTDSPELPIPSESCTHHAPMCKLPPTCFATFLNPPHVHSKNQPCATSPITRPVQRPFWLPSRYRPLTIANPGKAWGRMKPNY